MTKPLRGEVWWTSFRPAVGSEITKERPSVILSIPGVGRLPLTIAVPITDWKLDYAQLRWFVHLDPTSQNGLNKISGADGFQVKSISYDRLINKIGESPQDQIEDVAAAVAFCIGA
jgi:mRNA interferase MazF